MCDLKIYLNLMKTFSLEVDVQYPEKLHDNHNDLPFFSEKMKFEKIEEFVANSHDKENMFFT